MERAELEEYVRAHFTPPRQLAELSAAHITTFLALADGIAGYAQVCARQWPECELTAQAPAELKRIYVDPRWHGQGVAAELLRLAQSGARQRGGDMLWLAVWEINERAISFYRKSGFHEVGRQGFPIGHEVQSDLVMAKVLADELH